LFNLGLALLEVVDDDEEGRKRLEEAEVSLTEGLALARELGNKDMVARSLAKLGEVALQRTGGPNFEEAFALLKDSLTLSKELGDTRTIALVLDDLGFTSLLRGDLEQARTLFDESLQLSRTLEDKGFIVQNLTALAVTSAAGALESGNPEAEKSGARRAAKLRAAAAAIKDVTLIRIKRRYYDATMAILRALLPQDELVALEEAGRAMSVDEAIAFALAN
jgi:tetratricopeptide (TPR) repeat protein